MCIRDSCQSFSFEAIIGGSRYELDVMENIDVPSGMGAVSYTHLQQASLSERVDDIESDISSIRSDISDLESRLGSSDQ